MLVDMAKQMVFQEVTKHVESKSDLVFDVGPLLQYYFGSFSLKPSKYPIC